MRCWAYNRDGARCTLETKDHPDLHQVLIEWTDEESVEPDRVVHVPVADLPMRVDVPAPGYGTPTRGSDSEPPPVIIGSDGLPLPLAIVPDDGPPVDVNQRQRCMACNHPWHEGDCTAVVNRRAQPPILCGCQEPVE